MVAHTYSNGSAHLFVPEHGKQRQGDLKLEAGSASLCYMTIPYFTRVRAAIGILFGMKKSNLFVSLNFKMGYIKVHSSPQREQEIVYYTAKVIVALEHKFRFSHIPCFNVIPLS